jgi:hypothetical protein
VPTTLFGKRDVLNKKPVSGVKFNPLFDVHVRLYTVSTLKILLHEWGFDVESSIGYVVSDSTNHRINLLLAMVNRFFINSPSFAQGLVIKARAV